MRMCYVQNNNKQPKHAVGSVINAMSKQKTDEDDGKLIILIL